MLNYLLEVYARDGSSLYETGIPEAILPINSALDVLDTLFKLRSFILGGDIYEKSDDGCFITTYSNWYYEGKDFRESIFYAKEYLLKCEKNEFVSFIFKEQNFA